MNLMIFAEIRTTKLADVRVTGRDWKALQVIASRTLSLKTLV